MMTFKRFLTERYDFPAGMSTEMFHRGHADALVRYVDEVVFPAGQPAGVCTTETEMPQPALPVPAGAPTVDLGDAPLSGGNDDG